MSKMSIIEVLKNIIECEEWKKVFTNTNLSQFIEKHLQNNESSILIKTIQHPAQYYATLFWVILSAKNDSFNLITILKSIRPSDREVFMFFLKEVLIKKPASIKNSPLKTLIESLLKLF